MVDPVLAHLYYSEPVCGAVIATSRGPTIAIVVQVLSLHARKQAQSLHHKGQRFRGSDNSDICHKEYACGC